MLEFNVHCVDVRTNRSGSEFIKGILYTHGFPLFSRGVDHIINLVGCTALPQPEFRRLSTLLRDDRYTFPFRA